MNEIDVTRILGAPGTGKTTTMVGNVGLDKDGLFIENLDDYALDEQMLVTYTNAGVDEAVDRLYQMTDHLKKDIEDRVTTIHSRCYQSLDVDYDDVVGWRDEKDFCEGAGLDYGFDDDDGDAMSRDDQSAGNALMDIYGWLKSNRLHLDEYHQYPNQWPSERPLGPLLHAWEEYKEENGLVDFSDMIEKCVVKCVDMLRRAGFGDQTLDDNVEYLHSVRDDPEALERKGAIRGNNTFIDTKVLYVDEFQDLTGLQYAWFLCQKLVCEKVYIGGDEDQTIYGWGGADPRFFLEEEGDVELLEKTYRVPQDVWEYCEACIEQVDDRHGKDVEPVDEEGEVVTLRRPTGTMLANQIEESIRDHDDSVMILCRTNSYVDEFRDTLHAAGIPYDNMSTFDTWGRDLLRLREPLLKMRNKNPVDADGVRVMLDEIHESGITGNREVCKDGISGMLDPSDVERMFEKPSYMNFIEWFTGKLDKDDYNYYEREALKQNVIRRNTDIDPSTVRIGTIHSAKGKEADTVIVTTDSTEKILGRGSGVPDDERRVYYVAMSRASRKLILAEGVINPIHTISISTLVG